MSEHPMTTKLRDLTGPAGMSEHPMTYKLRD
jgi:hypothetical protein